MTQEGQGKDTITVEGTAGLTPGRRGAARVEYKPRDQYQVDKLKECLEESEKLPARGCAGVERYRGVVQEDAHAAILAALVAERVLHLDLGLGGGAGEDVVAHGDGDGPLELDLVVVVHAVGPALARVDGEAGILRDAVGDGVAADKVRHGRLSRRAELHLGAPGRLEEHVAVAVGVQLGGGVGGGGHVITAVL
eukprot:scaffold19262_cov117-Isochrysis_galbana.AAC.1